MWSFFPNKSQPKLSDVEKLKGYHGIAEEAVTRAHAADTGRQREGALKLYCTALDAVQEGLKLPVQGSGLGPKASNIDGWQADLLTWQEWLVKRIRSIEQRTSCTTPPPLPTPPSKALPHSQTFPRSAPSTSQTPLSSTSSPLQSHPIPSSMIPPNTSPTVKRTLNKQFQNQQLGSGRFPGESTVNGTSPVALGVGQKVPATAASGQLHSVGADEKLRSIIMGEILDRSPSVRWCDVVGLDTAKQALQESVILPTQRPDLFQGLRSPIRGILLYGPPGNGKTMLGKALASEAGATFFNISASSLTSKWVGEGEKLVRVLFQVAAELQPSIIFMDELDSLLSARTTNENDAMRRLKTEFLVQFDGVASGEEQVVVIGATNRPYDLDEAVRRRLVKRIYIPLPDDAGRREIVRHLMKGQVHTLRENDIHAFVQATEGFSASDLTALCKEAAMGPIRELGEKVRNVDAKKIRGIGSRDFAMALKMIRASVGEDSLKTFENFTREYGTA